MFIIKSKCIIMNFITHAYTVIILVIYSNLSHEMRINDYTVITIFINQDIMIFRILCPRQSSASKRDVCTTMVGKPGFFSDRTVLPLAFFEWLRYQSHMGDDSIENLARKLAESVPEGLRSMRDDLETNFRGVLRSGISKLDLVTREEFEVAEAVLARTREKLERLEAKFEEIEKEL